MPFGRTVIDYIKQSNSPENIFENAPGVKEARDGPTWNFLEKYRKNAPRPKFWTPRTYPPPKYPQNTEKIPKMPVFVFFFSAFWGYSLKTVTSLNKESRLLPFHLS